MSMALQQAVSDLRRVVEEQAERLTRLHGQLVIEQTKRSELSQRIATLEAQAARTEDRHAHRQGPKHRT